MPKAMLDHEPPKVPGLDAWAMTPAKWELTGSVDALEAAGCNISMLKSAIVVQRPCPDYPGVTLKPFQREGVSKISAILKRHGGAILGDEMGLGKTVQGAVIGEYLRGDDRVLVVCPAGVRHQWEQWASRLTKGEVLNLGPPSEPKYKPSWDRWSDRAAKVAWAMTSYQLMDRAMETQKPRVLILDEPHTQMIGRANKYVKVMWKWGALIQYKLALTGSPYLSEPKGLWQILNVLLGMRFGRAEDFDFWYCNATVNPYGGREVKGANKDHVTELRQRLSHYMVRREKAQVSMDLPKVSFVTRWVDGNRAAAQAMVAAQHTTDGLRRAMEPTLRDKIPTVVQLVKDATGPSVVFCWRRTDCEQVAVALEKHDHDAIVIHGEYPPQARAAMIAVAQKTKKTVVTTYGASGTGLDGLQHLSANFIAHAIEPSVAATLQAVARLDRMGQTLPVTATFVAMHDSVDELIVDKSISRISDYQAIFGQEVPSTGVKEALLKGNMGDIDNDAILRAIFEDIS